MSRILTTSGKLQEALASLHRFLFARIEDLNGALAALDEGYLELRLKIADVEDCLDVVEMLQRECEPELQGHELDLLQELLVVKMVAFCREVEEFIAKHTPGG